MTGPLRVLVTGASGFVGRAVCATLLSQGVQVRAAVRAGASTVPDGCEPAILGDLARQPDLRPALAGAGAVIHLAAKVHELHPGADADEAYLAVNRDATERLAREAARAGARRFVFVSTIKVNGERTAPGEAFRHADPARPEDAYARSKWQAEQALAAVAAETGIEPVIVRPPLVYGPGVGANFLRLVRLVERRLPLPFRSIRNRRSLLYVGNLAELLALCTTHPAAAGRTLLAADGDDVSTPALVRALAHALGVPPRLVPFPPPVLRLLGAAAGRRAEIGRLLDSLAVDDREARERLGWRPPFALQRGITHTVTWYRSRYP